MLRQQNNMQYPLLGNLTPQQLKELLLNYMKDEAQASEFYSRLVNNAPNELHREFILDARDDELQHLQKFENLYVQYFGEKPQYTFTYIEFPTYKEGLLMALQDELKAAAAYRDVQLSTKDPLVRDTFFYAMVDEMEHANQFGVLFNTV
jgi:rubrerythrin